MSYEITFLGTSSMVPTKDRNVQSIYLDYKGEGILIDCGEGTQRQMNIKGINRLKVKKVLISHWHGDHVSGLIGFIQTIGNQEGDIELKIFGPRGTKKHMNHLLNSCIFDLSVKLDIQEISAKTKKVIFENDDYIIQAAELDHATPCLGYSFSEKDKRKINMIKAKKLGLTQGPSIGKLQAGNSVTANGKQIFPDDVSTIVKGKKITFILDTTPNKNCYELSQGAEILVSEATYDSTYTEKAIQYKHMTTEQAAIIASKSNVNQLILTHFSQRYKTLHALEKEAKSIFPNTILAYDFMKIKL